MNLRDEAGQSFIELLVTIVILATVVVAIIAGMSASTLASGTHRQQAEAHEILISAVERLKTNTEVAYVPCAAKTDASYLTAARNVTLPTGFSASGITISDIKFSDGGATATEFYSTPPASNCKDNVVDASGNLIYRLQQITLQVQSNNGKVSETLSFVKSGT